MILPPEFLGGQKENKLHLVFVQSIPDYYNFYKFFSTISPL